MADTIVKVDLLQKETERLLPYHFRGLAYANREFDWQLQQYGDTVRVQSFPRLQFSDYSGTGDIAASDVAITSQTLEVLQWKALLVDWDLKDKKQSNLALHTKTAEEIAYGMYLEYERHFFEVAWAGAHADNILAGWTLTATTAYEAIAKLRTARSKKDAYGQGVVFVSPDVTEALTGSTKFDATEAGHKDRANGYVGRTSWFDVIETNLLPEGATAWSTRIIAMENNSVSFVEQIQEMGSNEAPRSFATIIKAQLLFQGKVFDERSKEIAVVDLA